MPEPTINYVTTGPWGAGTGAPLDPVDVDANFYELAQAIVDMQNNPLQPKEIVNITVVDNRQMTIFLSDNTTFGPFTLPVARFAWTGPWVAGRLYRENDFFTVQGIGVFIVLVTHEAASEFDPSEVIESSESEDFAYQLMFGVPDRYEIAFHIPGPVGAGVEEGVALTAFVATQSFFFSNAFEGSQARLIVASDEESDSDSEVEGTIIIEIRRNNVPIGSLSFAMGEPEGVFESGGVPVQFVAGDVISWIRPDVLIDGAAGLTVTMVGRKTPLVT